MTSNFLMYYNSSFKFLKYYHTKPSYNNKKKMYFVCLG